MTERLDTQTEEWPLRPWLMAAQCALAGLLFHQLVDTEYGETLSTTRQAGAAFVAVATLSFVVTIERLRWIWAVAFAIAAGLVTAFVGWFTASYNLHGEIAEFPFLSGLAAVLIAAPLFQTVRDEGGWRFPYGKLHAHAWTDAVIGAASLFFTGITFLLAFLIASLFDVIGIDFLKDLLNEGWFDWLLAGFAFGAAFGLLRERDRLAATLQRLAMIILSVLAPVLAVALAVFLLSVPFTGLQRLWDSWVSAAALLLTASAGAVLLANAVVGDGRDDRSPNRILQWAALVLVAVVLPLAVLAGLAMGIRIAEYGWTPERIWGAIAVGIAVIYGLIGWWSVWKGRHDFDEVLRPLQVKLAIGVCGLAVFLALPILDFGAISAGSQVARLESGRIEPRQFDWAAMAFDFGPSGRNRLRDLARSGPREWRPLASEALGAKERWGIAEATRAATEADDVAARIRVLSPDITLTPDLLRRLARRHACRENSQCALLRVDRNRLALIASYRDGGHLSSMIVDLTEPADVEIARPAPAAPKATDLDRARIEVRTIQRRQIYVDGQPLGEVFE